MRKASLFIFLSVILGFANTQAQSFFVGAGSGFAIPAFTSDVLGTTTSTIDSNVIESVNFGSLGGGIPMDLVAGYMINANFGLQLGFEYLIGSKNTRSAINFPALNYNEIAFLRQARLMPSILIRSSGETFQPYSRFGLTIPLSTLTLTESEQTDDPGNGNTSTTRTHTRITGTNNLGFHAALGMQYKINEMFSIYAEVQALAQRARAKSGSITLYEVDGASAINDLSIAAKDWVYVDQLNQESNNPDPVYGPTYDQDNVTDLLMISQNLSSLGLKIGVVISLF